MAISDTITSMYENVGNVYDVLELAGADLTNVDKNIFNLKQSWEERLLYFLANGTDVVWNNWLPKVNGTGETITLNNTIQAKMDFVYKGNTSQESTTGKNLINLDASSFTQTGLIITNNNDGSFTINGTTTGADDVILTLNTNINNPLFSFENNTYLLKIFVESGTFTSESGTAYLIAQGTADGVGRNKFEINLKNTNLYATRELTTADNFSRFELYIPGTNRVFNNYKIKVLLAKTSDTSTSWEKFTGGNPAPNPDYPYPVNVVTGDNSIVVVGINLFDQETELGGINSITGAETTSPSVIRSKNYIPVQPNTEIYYYNGSENMWVYAYDKNKNFIGYATGNTSSVHSSSATTPNNCYYLRFQCRSQYGTTYKNDICINISNASINGRFYPYQSQTYPINLGSMELCKIGDYQDYIAKSTGKNLFDKDNINLLNNYYVDSTGKIVAGNYNKFNWIKLQPNTTYTLSQPKKSPVTIRITLFDTQPEANATGTILGTFATADGIIQTFTTTNNGIYLGWVYCNTSSLGGYTEQEMLDSIMLNEGTTALPYEPYGKVWYKYGAVGKYTFTGSESVNQYSSGTYSFGIYVDNMQKLYNASSVNVVCNKLTGSTTNNIYSNRNTAGYNLISSHTNSGTQSVFLVMINNYITTQEIQTYLTQQYQANTPMIAYYIELTPTITPITDTTLIYQLDNLEKAYSYDTQTNISQTNQDKPFIISYEAILSLKNVLNS